MKCAHFIMIILQLQVVTKSRVINNSSYLRKVYEIQGKHIRCDQYNAILNKKLKSCLFNNLHVIFC
jgi:hypothetical protein